VQDWRFFWDKHPATIKNSAKFEVFTAVLLKTQAGYYLPHDNVSYSKKLDSTQNNL
jgi:hypothetical protein